MILHIFKIVLSIAAFLFGFSLILLADVNPDYWWGTIIGVLIMVFIERRYKLVDKILG